MIPIKLLEDYDYRSRGWTKEAANLVYESVMQLESIEQINAEPYQRIESRKAHRMVTKSVP